VTSEVLAVKTTSIPCPLGVIADILKTYEDWGVNGFTVIVLSGVVRFPS